MKIRVIADKKPDTCDNCSITFCHLARCRDEGEKVHKNCLLVADPIDQIIEDVMALEVEHKLETFTISHTGNDVTRESYRFKGNNDWKSSVGIVVYDEVKKRVLELTKQKLSENGI